MGQVSDLWGCAAHAVKAAVLLAGVLIAAPVKACNTALILALDVSASVSAEEYQLQQEGLAQALSAPDVVEAILGQGGIWLSVFEWSGSRHQYMQVDWRFLSDEAGIYQAAQSIRSAQRSVTEFPTALGYALGYAMILMRELPEPCARRIIDVSGDGVNNAGFPPQSAYRAHDMAGIMVNGLVIDGEIPSPLPYYETHVILGPGAFVEVTHSYSDYARAMRQKLLRELGAVGLAGLR